MVKNSTILLVVIFVGLIVLAGCSLDSSSPSVGSVPSPVPPTVVTQPRLTAAATSTRWVPSRIPTRVSPTSRPSPTNVPNCRYDAAFVRDVNIPDGTIMRPDERHSKAWELRNTGTYHWYDDVRLTPHRDGKPVHWAGLEVVPLTLAGATAEIAHSMTMPGTDGNYEARYQLCAGMHCFGPVFWIRVTVRGGTAPTRAPILMPTWVPTRAPTPVPHINGWTGYTCDRCIKGNISYRTGERIYHFPGCTYYEQTVINTRYGERWFSNEAEAVLAGWRRALNCP